MTEETQDELPHGIHQHCDTAAYFDYWGKGTTVTVTSGTPAPTVRPKLFPLGQCDSGAGDQVTFGCLAHDFNPGSLTFTWTDQRGTSLDSQQYISGPNNNKYTGVSVIKVSRSDTLSLSYNCAVTHPGGNGRVQLYKSIPPKVTLLSTPTGDKQTLVCTAEEFYPGKVEFSWKKNGNTVTGFTAWSPKDVQNVYSSISVLKVNKRDWDSKAVYTCEVTHKGQKYTKKISEAPFTVTLKSPNPIKVFNNNQVELECVVSGEDGTIISETTITWQINGQTVTNNINTQASTKSKTSKLTQSLTEWKSVNTVRCSATRGDMTPVIQELTVNKGNGTSPTVTVHTLPENIIDNRGSAEVTLVCLVSSPVLQDHYITWSEDAGGFTDGTSFPPQKTTDGYSVTSLYITTKEKWNQNKMFYCNVRSAGSDQPIRSRGVSKATAPFTVTLKSPNPIKVFNNSQVELECVVSGEDGTIISETTIAWQINGQTVTNNINTKADTKSKTSKLTQSLTEWKSVNTVRCSATRGDMTPVIQELTVNKGNGTSPTVTVHTLPENIIDNRGSAEVTLVCLVSSPVLQDHYITWSEDAGGFTDGTSFPPQKTTDGYSVTSLYITTKEKWNQNKMFYCNVRSAGRDQPIRSRGVSKATAPFTVTLKSPNPIKVFNNSQVELECVVSGEDGTIVSETTITWQINGQTVTNNINTQADTKSKTSKLTQSLTEWKSVNTVRCSATRGDMTPVIQELTVNKGDGTSPTVTVHTLPENIIDNRGSAEVTLVCLVSSPVLQDHYITWSEDAGGFTDGTSFPPQKTTDGYSVTSLYITTKEKWNQNKMFYCNVRSAGRDQPIKSPGVSKATAPFTVTLKSPNPIKVFNNNQVELECVVSGEDRTVVSETTITWQINGRTVTKNINTQASTKSKTSKLTQSLTEWKSVNTVRCSAARGDMTPVIQELTVNKGNGTSPTVTVHTLPENIIDNRGSAEVTLVCLVSSPVLQDHYITWSEDAGGFTDGTSFPPQKTTDGYSVTSLYITTKEKWNQNKMFYCNVRSAGRDQPIRSRGVSKATAPFTVTLKSPNPIKVFNNSQVELECVVSGEDGTIVSETTIAWQINGQTVTNNINTKADTKSKTSKLTQSLTEWKSVNTVRCSATRGDMTPVIQELTVNKGDGTSPTVTVHTLPENIIDNRGSAEVTLVCLVSSPVLQDHYITWSEDAGGFTDGTSFPPQKTTDGYSVTSLYITTKEKWNQNKMFYCNVRSAGRDQPIRSRGVSKATAPFTVTLKSPNPIKVFNNSQVELECVVSGEDGSIISETTITWQINGQTVTNNINTKADTKSKTSKLTQSLTEWKTVNTVRCSATRGDMTPVIQELTVNKGDGTSPTVTVHTLPENIIDNRGSAEVTLVCLVSSPVLQDHYITWSEDAGGFTDGTSFPPQKTTDGYSVTSLYITTKEKWNQNKMFYCNVRSAGRDQPIRSRGVSKATAPFTVTLKSPNPIKVFNNNQVELECVVSGEDGTIVSETNMAWQVNGQTVTNNINLKAGTKSKTSKLTQSLTEWKSVNTVRCSAARGDMTPVIQELTVNKGNGTSPTVTVHTLPENIIDNRGSAEVTLVCLVSSPVLQDHYITWSEDAGGFTDGTSFPPQKTTDGYSVTSLYITTKEKWNQNKIFYCNVRSAGSDQPIRSRGVSKAIAPFTVTLKSPNPIKVFNNNQVELECVVSGEDGTIVSETTIAWQVNGKPVTNNINLKAGTKSKTSKLTQSLTEWKSVNTVRCSAARGDMTPVIQELTVNKGDGTSPTVTVHTLPENIIDNRGSAEVTLVCLVSSPVLQDHYITWSEDAGGFTDGTSFPPQKTTDGYSVTSLYITTKEKWNQNKIFYCNVRSAGSDQPIRSRGVSKAIAPFTVTLKSPNPIKVFNNNQVELECVVSGEDGTIVSETTIAWQVNGKPVTNNINLKAGTKSKTSKLTQSLTEWKSVNTVRCSAARGDMTPVIQELTVNKGNGTSPTVTVHTLPENIIDNRGSAEVTLVCLVSSPVLQDHYITWSEDAGGFTDGTSFPPQKTTDGYSVTSLYITTKEKWNQNKMFYCNVRSAGSDQSIRSREVSKATAPFTVTLKSPNPIKVFNNNQVELECVVSGEDGTIVSETNMAWQVNGKPVTNNINLKAGTKSKTSKLTQSLTEWKSVNTVRCSAARGDMTPVIQELTVNKGNGTSPTVTVHTLPENIIDNRGSAEVTLVCLVSSPVLQDHYITWSEDAGGFTDGTSFPPQKTTDGYSVTSLYITTKEKWNQNKIFYCNVRSAGSDQPIRSRGVSKATALFTVRLNSPNPKRIFTSNEVELECNVTGQDATVVSETTITWQINGRTVTNNINTQNITQGKTSKLTQSLTEWKSVNTVRCSATRGEMTPVTQELTVNKGNATNTNVSVHILPDKFTENSAEVTLVCLVSSPVLQDYYIAWKEDGGVFTDGTSFPPQKTKDGYSVTSLYITTKEKWDKHKTFHCNVWSAGSDGPMKPQGVSKATDCALKSESGFAVNCTDNVTEEDEFSSLWFTSSSFIVLFIFSLIYSIIFSLIKVKKH
ncbi:uncharacterized protein LOC124997821 [Mugil cephalus]|uniref:uncharacterized protein LOC124997821 n=1 Tax=Mugil cephalus TaxID=48193 RepID=UPI001FB60873|nr:uncharacterized protein LOC124997821 [Mugil cephalus]